MTTVCLLAATAGYPEGGGHFWVYANWALGFRAAGCRVSWLEIERGNVDALRRNLAEAGLADVAFAFGEPPAADILVNLDPNAPAHVVGAFPRSVFVDIDPGLTQFWLRTGGMNIAPHDMWFTIGERVLEPSTTWLHTPPCVSLDAWPVVRATDDAPFTTVAHWSGDYWVEDDDTDGYLNEKCVGFEPYIDLPRRVNSSLELALDLGDDEESRERLKANGWHVRDASEVASTPASYRDYIAASRGEMSCAKPSTRKMPHAWVSDRTLCYLASGKPCVVEHTGVSAILPDAEGIFRFHDFDEAVRYLEIVEADYDRQSSAARALAEDVFDAGKVAASLLERAL
jgi:hypothetical protein